MKMKMTTGKILGIIAISLMCISAIVGGFISGLPWVGVILALIMAGGTVVSTLRENYELYCKKCKLKYDFDNDVEYRQVDRIVKTYRPTENPRSSDIREKEIYVVEFACTCSQCKERKTYKKKIDGAKITFGGDYTEGDPEYFIEKYFTRKTDTTGQGIIALLLGIVVSAALIVGSALVGGIFNPSIANDIDPENYFGTYYYQHHDAIVSVKISDDKCDVNIDHLITEDEAYTYYSRKYYSAESASAINESFNHPGCDLIIFYNESADDGLMLWVKSSGNGVYTFESNAGALTSKSAITFESITNDPKNYYGTYYNGNEYLTINNNGTAVANIGEGTQNYKYVYADATLANTILVEDPNTNSIILFNDPSDGLYVFEIQNDGSLLLADEYLFTIDGGNGGNNGGDVENDTPVVETPTDPKDYYGKYYVQFDSQILTFEFSENGCIYTVDNFLNADETTNCTYKYYTAEEAASSSAGTANEGKALIFVYSDASQTTGVSLWVKSVDNGVYTFSSNYGDVTTTPITFESITGDPKNYYGTYYYGDLYLTINEDGTAIVDLGDGATNMSFAYVDVAFGSIVLANPPAANSILVYSESLDEIYVFQFKDANTLCLAGTYDFTK